MYVVMQMQHVTGFVKGTPSAFSNASTLKTRICITVQGADECRRREGERATTAYTRVPSKSKSLASQLPHMETNRSIKHHDDDTENPSVP